MTSRNGNNPGEAWDDPEGLEGDEVAGGASAADELSDLFMLAFAVLSIGAICLPVLVVWEQFGTPPFGAWIVVAAIWISGAMLAVGDKV